MPKPFSILQQEMSPERQARNEAKAKACLESMRVEELRRALEQTQQDLASSMNMSQAAISKIEHQADMYVSTLRRFVEAMGGELRIVAHFPGGDVTIKQFSGDTEAE